MGRNMLIIRLVKYRWSIKRWQSEPRRDFNNIDMEDTSNTIQNLACDVNADKDENEKSTSSQNITIGLAGFLHSKCIY